MKTGIANLPLHTGSCPAWLFKRMVKLSYFITEIIIDELGTDLFLKRLSDPFFFQSLGCVLGFDWHSSGVTTTVCGALKEALNKNNSSLKVAGGKGKSGLNTLNEIENSNLTTAKIECLKRASKLAAKVDNALVQDNYNLYHHCIFFNENGKWAVIQQGLNNNNNYARRYHWLSNSVNSYVTEPHSAICCDIKQNQMLNLTSKICKETQKVSVDIVKDFKHLTLKPEHEILRHELTSYTIKTLKAAYEIQPNNYEDLISIKGIGAKTLRALALISELVYGTENSWSDPAKFSFAHGGKDGFPYPVNKKCYDQTIKILKNAVNDSRIGNKDKVQALKRLNSFINHKK